METVLGSFLQVAFDRLVPRDVKQFLLHLNVDVNTELDKLKRNFKKVSLVLHDAEKKQIRIPEVREWLDELRHLVYDLDDLLDKIAMDAKTWKFEKESETHYGSQVCPIISRIQNFWSESKQVDMIKSLTARFDEITNQSHDLGLIHGVRESPMGVEQRPPTTSIVNESSICGRGKDADQILQQLLSAAAGESGPKRISVIPIVGMGGVGKTTLARLVYNNHERLEKGRFDLKIWVCISNIFDLTKTTKSIIESITGRSPDQNELQSLQINLQDQLRGKRFLLVLDDVWTEKPNDWDDLLAPFEVAANGSCVLVTTRSEKVSAVMRTVDNHTLRELSDADCQTVFYRRAFIDGNADEHPELKVLGDEIVKKCKGLPLAAKTLGGLLRCNLDIAEWKRVLHDDIWDLPEEKSDILSSLRLSYYYLPSPLKRCFSYCAMFPQDYEFHKGKLVLLWMAEGFLHPQPNKRMEDIGDQYFDELLSRSFFQQSLDRNGEPVFVMHDLIHDLAQHISKGICLNVEDGMEVDDDSWKHHVSLVRHMFVRCENKSNVISLIAEAKKLRSILFTAPPFNERILCDLAQQLTCLRVLSLEDCFDVRELPESIGKLKGLRYINIGKTCIRRLPESMTTLYNLQTLIGSYGLVELPNDFSNLTELRHLLVCGHNGLEKMPAGLGRLTNLQSLPMFVVGKDDGSKIKELREMQYLRGKLCIARLENVVDALDAKQANMRSKKHLHKLEFRWSDSNYSRAGGRVEEDVINGLQPHTNIRELRIYSYYGERLPNWLGCSFYSMLETLKLVNCSKCECLPSLGCLRSLKHLVIDGLIAVKKVGPEFYGVGHIVKPFESLKSLEFYYMNHWEEWFGIEEEYEEEFPHLQCLDLCGCPNLKRISCQFQKLEELRIINSPKLIVLPKCLPMLRKLDIKRGCDEQIFRTSVFDPSPPLTSLQISGISNLSYLPLEEGRLLGCLSTLPQLDIKDCEGLVTLLPSSSKARGGLQQLASLQSLVIEDCPNLVCLSEVDEDVLPPKLENLVIRGCSKLQKLQHFNFSGGEMVEFPNLVVPSPQVGSLSMLNYLSISTCHNLQFPEEMELPSTLKHLRFEGCHSMGRLPKRMTQNTCLENFQIVDCSSLVSFPEEMELPSTLKSLEIMRCKNLKTLPDGMLCSNSDSFIDHLFISGCNSLSSFTTSNSSSGFLLLPKKLEIRECPNLVSLPVEMLHNNRFLETLVIEDCGSLRSFRRRCLGLDPHTVAVVDHLDNLSLNQAKGRRIAIITNIKEIKIRSCKNLESLPYSMSMLTSLQSLTIEDCDNLASFPNGGLPIANLRKIVIKNCMTLESLPERFHDVTPLQVLQICDCPALNPFPEAGFPRNITSLILGNCGKQKPMSEWGLGKLTSLTSLSIEGFSGIVSFPVSLLPPNLTKLSIIGLSDLQFLPEELHTLTSLEQLHIYNCNNLVSFPEKGLPSSLDELWIGGCPALEELCEKEIGEERSKIGKIPKVYLNGSLDFFRGF